MIYNKIIEGNFIERPNRFIAKVLIDDKEEIAHVKNTGRCKELLVPGARIILEDCSHNPNRKTKYSLIAVYKDDILINMDSQAPNTVVFDGLKNNQILEFQDLSHIKKEMKYKNSRFDIYFEKGDQRGFIEVKGVTLEEDGIARFPDAPTERGAKHVLEMIEAVKEGYLGAILFLIQMKDPKEFRLNWKTDENFSKAVNKAENSGVQILAYDSIVKEYSISINNPVKIDLKK